MCIHHSSKAGSHEKDKPQEKHTTTDDRVLCELKAAIFNLTKGFNYAKKDYIIIKKEQSE